MANQTVASTVLIFLMFSYVHVITLTRASPVKQGKQGLEEGELSHGDSPVKTPLRTLHEKKISRIDGSRLTDSLQKTRKRQKLPESEDSEDIEEESSFEGSVIDGLKRRKSGSVSLRATGLLENKRFLTVLSIPDRRDLKSLGGWLFFWNSPLK